MLLLLTAGLSLASEIARNGYYAVGDLRLSEDQYKAYFGTEEEMRQAHPEERYRWTNGVVPYAFKKNIKKANKVKINKAIEVLNAALENCLVIRYSMINDNYCSK